MYRRPGKDSQSLAGFPYAIDLITLEEGGQAGWVVEGGDLEGEDLADCMQHNTLISWNS